MNGVKASSIMILSFLNYSLIRPWKPWNTFQEFSKVLRNMSSLKAKKLSCHLLFLVTSTMPGILVLVSATMCGRNITVGCSIYTSLKRISSLCVNQNIKVWWFFIGTTTKKSYPVLIEHMCIKS